MTNGGPRTHQRFKKLRTLDNKNSTESTTPSSARSVKLSFRRKKLSEKVLPKNSQELQNDFSNEKSEYEAIEQSPMTKQNSEISEKKISNNFQESQDDQQNEDYEYEVIEQALVTPVPKDSIKIESSTEHSRFAKHKSFRDFREKNFIKYLGATAKDKFNLYLNLEDTHVSNPDLLAKSNITALKIQNESTTVSTTT